MQIFHLMHYFVDKCLKPHILLDNKSGGGKIDSIKELKKRNFNLYSFIKD